MSHAQTWQQIPNTPNISAYNPLLLTDGTVLIQDGDNDDWWKLTPDKTGSYLNGKWTQLASTPGYGPLYYASAVLPDGRVFTMGGEYNMGSGEIWQNAGYMYDPVTNKWTFLPAPTGWANIGDMGSVVLPNGKLMVMDPFSAQGALFDPVTGLFTVPYGTGKFDVNDEEGLTLLPNGTILTVDTTSPHSEIFNPTTLQWTSAGSTPASLVGLGEEIGPQVLRYDGTVICFGGGSHNCVYNTNTGKWSAAPDFPTINSVAECCADAPACLLTNGNVLVQCGPPSFGSGSVFLEWDGSTLTQVAPTPNAAGDPSFVGSMLMLPTGQVMVTDLSNDIELYNSTGSPKASWAPTISSVPVVVSGGGSYVITGTQFNGLSGSSAYGDDEQNETNYPLIRITNNATGHVFYCKEYNPSTMAICTGSKIVSTNFTVPASIEEGASTIQVVTNGIPSAAVAISVGPPIKASNVSVVSGSYVRGTLSSLWSIDGNTYEVRSQSSPVGQLAALEADFTLPISSTTVSTLSVYATAAAQPGITGELYMYDWVADAWVYLPNSSPLGSAQTTFSAPGTGTISRFIGPNNEVRTIIRAVGPNHIVAAPFTLSVDQIYIG
jgi:hypothetical protein